MALGPFARDLVRLRERDPGFFCAYCSAPLATPLRLAGTEHMAWESDGWELAMDNDGNAEWVLLEGHRVPHRDHVHPRSAGGPDHIDNLVLVCEACNLEKKHRPLIMFLARRAGVPHYRSDGGDHARIFAERWSAA